MQQFRSNSLRLDWQPRPSLPCRFEQPEAAKAAIDSMNGFDLGGRQLKVRFLFSRVGPSLPSAKLRSSNAVLTDVAFVRLALSYTRRPSPCFLHYDELLGIVSQISRLLYHVFKPSYVKHSQAQYHKISFSLFSTWPLFCGPRLLQPLHAVDVYAPA